MQTLTEKIWNFNPLDGLFNKSVLNNLYQKNSSNAIKFLINKVLKNIETNA